MRDFIDIEGMNVFESAEYFQNFITQFEDKKLYPYGFVSDSAIGKNMTVVDFYSKSVTQTISFVTNNYLGMTQNQEVQNAAKKAIDSFGTGTCAAPPIGGYMESHKILEEKLAKLHDKEKAILFASGYTANIGVFQNLFNKLDLVLVDMFVHASIYDGLKNNTNIKIYKHNDMSYLELVLQREYKKHRNMAIVIDGVFSQDGDLANLPDICMLAKKYQAMVCVDDAHGVGVFGQNGKGTLDHFGVADKVDLVTGTFSKSMGTTGGYVAGSEKLIEYMRHYSRSNTFSASLSPASVAAASKAIDVFTANPQYINKLWENTHYLKKRLIDCGFDIGISESPITPLMIRNDEKTLFIARKLLERGIYVVPAIYPAVKLNDSRFRVNVTAQHEIEDLDFFCKTLLNLDNEYNLKLRK